MMMYVVSKPYKNRPVDGNKERSMDERNNTLYYYYFMTSYITLTLTSILPQHFLQIVHYI